MPIVDVEIGGELGGPLRAVVTRDRQSVVLYLRRVPLARVAEEAALALNLRRRPEERYVLLSDGQALDLSRPLDEDLSVDIEVRI